MIEFDRVLFIRLGRESNWAKNCIEKGTLTLGYSSELHENCLNGDWDTVLEYWTKKCKTKGKAKDYTNQIQSFYTADSKVLWVTFWERKLYYCFSTPEITEVNKGGERERKTINGWSCKDIENNDLTFDRLSTKLTKTQGYQGTICEIKEIEYLKNKINCSSSEITKIVKVKKEELIDAIIPLLKDLNWYDFELLVDLIFTYSGWKRIETLGKTQESIDLDLQLPINNKRAFVQVKSKSTFKEYSDYKDDFENMNQYDEFYYFVNCADKKLIDDSRNYGSQIYTDKTLAGLVLKSGLLDWLIEKTN